MPTNRLRLIYNSDTLGIGRVEKGSAICYPLMFHMILFQLYKPTPVKLCYYFF